MRLWCPIHALWGLALAAAAQGQEAPLVGTIACEGGLVSLNDWHQARQLPAAGVRVAMQVPLGQVPELFIALEAGALFGPSPPALAELSVAAPPLFVLDQRVAMGVDPGELGGAFFQLGGSLMEVGPVVEGPRIDLFYDLRTGARLFRESRRGRMVELGAQIALDPVLPGSFGVPMMGYVALGGATDAN